MGTIKKPIVHSENPVVVMNMLNQTLDSMKGNLNRHFFDSIAENMLHYFVEFNFLCWDCFIPLLWG